LYHLHISIHALRAERDLACTSYYKHLVEFQSTRSERSATAAKKVAFERYPNDFNPRAPSGARREYSKPRTKILAISIHALRAERDFYESKGWKVGSDFNPRAPSGARRKKSRNK